MLLLNLPKIEENAEPAFADSMSCARWISQFQLTDIRLAHGTLAKKLWEVNRSRIPPLDRLKITEQLRDTVSIVQDGYARKIIGKPLPFDEIESRVLDEILSLWEAMTASYGHCLKACMEGDPGVSRHLALICQRCLRYTGLQIAEYLLMQHQCEPSLWLQLHQLYLFSEEKGFSSFPILESLKLYPRPTSCADHFVRTVLICQASPYELSRKQFQVVNRWLDEWVSWVDISGTLPATSRDTPPLEVDLESQDCVRPGTSEGRSIRYLDTSELGKNLRIKIALLQQGQKPSQIGLGDEFRTEFCIALIEKLHRYWCEGKVPRMFEKRSIRDETEICFGLESLHERLSGQTFAQPGEEGRLNHKQHEEIRLFGHVATRDGKKDSNETEKWDIQDENAKGFVLIRSGPGRRVGPGHLVGIQSGEDFLPCVIRWAIEGLDGSINMGLRLIEGRPEAVAIRATGISASGKYVQAVLLNSGEWSSLIMPKGWYVQGRIIEAVDADRLTMQLRLADLAGKGADYERAIFIQL